ncbi:MAG TPA: energy transducer TonB, partial [Candidatus Polarisedimenticolia bacterium]|nr:energy transducer TonB [Candidatus Polarisedimenticolia bacterium]
CVAEAPPSLADIARTMKAPREEGSVDTLRRALGGPDATSRAAAARIVTVGRVAALLDEARSALASEGDAATARELAAALLSLGDPGDDARVLEAADRFGGGTADRMELLIARVRGPDSVESYFDRLAKRPMSRRMRTIYFEIVTRRDAQLVRSAAGRALENGDEEAWAALLDLARAHRIGFDRSLMILALAHPNRDLAVETTWHLAGEFSRALPADPGSWRQEVERIGSTSIDPTDPDHRFAFELLHRALGRKPRQDDVWTRHTRSRETLRLDSVDWVSVLGPWLTRSEKKALRNRLKRLHPDWKLPALDSDAAPNRDDEPGPPPQPPPPVGLAGGFPPGFVSAALEATGCVLADKEIFLKSLVTYDVLGRPGRVVLLSTAPSARCTAAASLLMSASSVPPERLTDPAVPETLFLLLERGRLHRLEETPDQGGLPIYLTTQPGDVLVPPKRTVFVQPVYPETSRLGRREGRVILELILREDGLIGEARLLRQKADDDVLASAFRAISRWRYEPALLNGRPIEVYLTVIVDFNLR